MATRKTKKRKKAATKSAPNKQSRKKQAVIKTKGAAVKLSPGKSRAPAATAKRKMADGKPRKQAGTLEAGLVPVVGVGASAGGLEAFTLLLRVLPADTGMAFVLVTHLSHTHKSMMSELLSKATRMQVTQAGRRTRIEPNHVYVIPPNKELTIKNGLLTAKPLSPSRRPPMVIDSFLRSLAESRKNGAVGVILSGTGTDGTSGLAAVKAEGGTAFAQDEASAKYPDMPRSASAAPGSVDFVLPPEAIAKELARVARHPYVVATKPRAPADPGPKHELGKVFRMILNATGVDFSHYKPPTIRRRMLRRMMLRRVKTLSQYLELLRSDSDQVVALYHDLLINVTGFFRDPATFDVLRRKVVPEITKKQQRDVPIRIWVPACATGEEVYSLAICFLEALAESKIRRPLQIFATDVSGDVIKMAREGFYRENISLEVSPERLRRFFVKTEGGYQITKSVRDLCVFAVQNVVKDPPFSRMDLISCRNLLIYLEQPLQKKVLAPSTTR